MSYRCIECNQPAEELYHQYSPTVLKLTECKACGSVVDKYVECDNMLIFLDLMLQKVPSYRHVLYNSGFQSYFRLGVVFILCDAYFKWVTLRNLDSETMQIYELEWRFYGCFLQSISGVATFILCLLVLLRLLYTGDKRLSQVAIVKCLMASFYGNVMLVLSVIWGQNRNLNYVLLIQAFLLVSHIQTLRAFTTVGVLRGAVLVTVAKAAQFLAEYSFTQLNLVE